MKKQLFTSAVIALIGYGVFAGDAMANTLPTLPDSDPSSAMSGYSWSSSDYWNVIDTRSATGLFTLNFINIDATYRSTFGLYAYGDKNNKIEIFGATKGSDKSVAESNSNTVSFLFDGGVWKVKTNLMTDYTSFASSFGFYSDVTPDGSQNSYTLYTDKALNADHNEHFAIATKTPNLAKIYLEDLLNTDIWDPNSTDSYDKMVFTTNITPVPEPVSMLLFGTGIVGLAGITRRRRANLS